jgi:hypothetical protein
MVSTKVVVALLAMTVFEVVWRRVADVMLFAQDCAHASHLCTAALLTSPPHIFNASTAIPYFLTQHKTT